MELKQFKTDILPLRDRLLRQAYKLTGNTSDAEDIVQEVMLKLWNIRHQLAEYRSIEALAVTMTRNLSVDLLRRYKGDHLSLEQIVTASPVVDPQRELEKKDEFRMITEIIASLPALQQTIIRMKDMERYETEEIAAITGCQSEAIRSNLSRARKKVREAYLKMKHTHTGNTSWNPKIS